MSYYDDVDFALAGQEADNDSGGFECEGGLKYDNDKPRMDLLPLDALEEVAKVLTFGAKKYAANTWQKVPDAERRYVAALLRHLTACEKGETNDTESGLTHAAHMATNALFILWFELQKGAENGGTK